MLLLGRPSTGFRVNGEVEGMSTHTGYQMCTRCVMDTTAEEISFDEKGVCSFCHYFDREVQPVLARARSEEGRQLLLRVVETIKEAGRGKAHDCVLGLSGGTDSSYLTYLAVQFGLRPLVVHVDTGWDTEVAAANIRNLVEKLGLEVEMVTVDWDEMRDLQIAFYRAAVRNCEIPQDHAFLAALYHTAGRHGIRFLLSGGNLATESVLPRSWGYNAGDLRHLLDVHRRFGSGRLKRFPMLSFWQRYFYYPFLKGIREVRLLNYVPYNKAEAKELLKRECGWQDYGGKHFESVLTRFFQGYYLPTKFGIDKRKAHFSSLILAGQMTREAALEELKQPPYSLEQAEADKEYIAQALGLTLQEWESILATPARDHRDFKSSSAMFALKDYLVRRIKVPGRGFKG